MLSCVQSRARHEKGSQARRGKEIRGRGLLSARRDGARPAQRPAEVRPQGWGLSRSPHHCLHRAKSTEQVACGYLHIRSAHDSKTRAIADYWSSVAHDMNLHSVDAGEWRAAAAFSERST